MTDVGFPHVPEDYAAGERSLPYIIRDWMQQMARAINSLRDGKINPRGSLSLNTSGTTTTLNDQRISPSSVVIVMPGDATTAGESGLWAEPGDRTATIHHVENAASRTVRYAIIG